MPSSNLGRLTVGEFARQIRDQMIPISSRFSYFFTALPLNEEDIKELLEDPLSALPPSIRGLLPETSILLVPYLEKASAKEPPLEASDAYVCFEQPDQKLQIWGCRVGALDRAVLVLALKDHDVAEYHYRFFREVAGLVMELAGDDILDQFFGIVRDELSAGVHGEVDEESWALKQALMRRQRDFRRRTKGFAHYARQALVDTLTLYLHGICCDIDVDPGPRQLASRHLRRRLELLQSLYPPPTGYAVFPEDRNHPEG